MTPTAEVHGEAPGLDSTEAGMGPSTRRVLRPWEVRLVSVVAIAMTLLHLYTAYFGIFTAFRQRSWHIVFALTLCFLLYSGGTARREGVAWYDWALIGLALYAYGHMIYFADALSARMALVTPLSAGQFLAGVIGILLLVEGARRALGVAFALIIGGALLYALAGDHLPGLFSHRGFSFMWIVDHLYFTWEGVFGIPAAVSSTYIFIFIAFAQFLNATGAGEFFIKFSTAAIGRYRGGPAKTAVLASGIMGSVSGSAVANVVGTGAITIPLMKRIGYRPQFAGAVEAVASTGGQIMPPVMGAAAFIMAEFTGISYANIMLAALVPAVLYYLGVGFQVHFEAVRLDLRPTAPGQAPPVWRTLFAGFHYFIPLGAIFYLLLRGYTPLYAGLAALILVVVVTSFRSVSRLTWPRLKEALESSARAAVDVAIATAGAGVVIGVVTLTGLGIRFSSLVVDMAAGQLFPALVLTMLVAIILGMGLPPVAAYLIQAALLAPTLVQLGVPVLAAHLFCFYFAIVSNITPPVALAAYAGASVAGSDPFRTAVTAMRLGSAAYIVPFMFVYGPALLLMGSPLEIAVAFVTACAGVFSLAIAAGGYYMRRITRPERLLFGAAALTLVKTSWTTDLVGLALMGAAIALHRAGAARARMVADDAPLRH